MQYNPCVSSVLTPTLDQWETYDPSTVSERETICGRRAFAKRSHGFLCFDHYVGQQENRPRAPRKPYREWREHYLDRAPDHILLSEIVKLEKRTIAALREANRVQTITYGKDEPVSIQVIHA